MNNIADKVADLCIQKYNSLRKTGKPNNNEWTVLSGIVVQNKNNSLSVVSLATGTKCLSGKELLSISPNERGCKLSDSHAEILARRAFLRYLYDQIDQVLNGFTSEIFFVDNSEKFCIRDGISFLFFSSQMPCGDCCIFSKDNNVETASPIKMRRIDLIEGDLKNQNSIASVQEVKNDIYRTGAKCVNTEIQQDPKLPGVNYHIVGPLRIKPGRGDPTLSLSCSDKLAKWNFLGMQGSLLSMLIPPIKISYIIIAGETPFSLAAMERGIYKRFNKIHGPKLMQANISFSQRKGAERIQPCPSSIIWMNIPRRDTEIAVNGQKQGTTKKRKGSNLSICRRSLFSTFLTISNKYKTLDQRVRHPKKIVYYHYKQASLQYQEQWSELKSKIFKYWPEKPLYLQEFML